MSRLGFKSVVYHGDACLGELEAIPFDDSNFQFPGNEIRIHHISPISERCSPLSVLQTVAPYSVRCKLESRVPVEKPHLINLHASCFHDLKTAVVLLGKEEVHLVAMPSKQKKFPCFWCFAVPRGLYSSCLWMLNLRCLAIVFDLDETLIVANTMKSFEDRIEVLRGWISRESDSVRSSGMSAELKRYMDDRALLRQYAEGDSVVLDGKELKVQLEEVPPLCDDHEKVVRPVVRLQERNIVLTRINPENRDTSVLVRLRPAWEDLRSYLTANGRKRFEVYVCTMAERDYAMEMWRLLDPEAHLISPKKILHRVVCVKSGSRKSLLNVFQDGICHPKMTMVIDDRLKVWEDVDQPRVHVVPAFTPYYAPQAEIANAVPVLCVARNVACNVRGGFFKEFDENLLRRISEVFYEDDMINLPNAPDVSNYLMSEDTSFVSNGNNNAPITEGMMGTDVTRRLQQSDDKILASFSTHSIINGPELRSDISQPTTVSTPSILGPSSMKLLVPSQKPSLLGPPLRRDKIKINQDLRNTAPGSGQVLPSFLQPQGDRLLEEEIKRNSRALGFTQNFDGLKREKQRVQSNLSRNIAPGYTISCLPAETSFMSSEEASRGPELQKQNLPPTGTLSENGASRSQVRINSRGIQTDVGRTNSSLSVGVLQEIGRICSSRVEFISVVSTSEDLHFSIEVFMTGEKIGVGTGKTRTDAEHQAAENALQSLADKYAAAAHIVPQSEAVDSSMDKHSLRSENGFLWDTSDPESNEMPTKDELSKESNSEAIVIAPGSTSELGNQRGLKRENSSRLQESISKRSKKEVFSDP